MAAFIIVFKHKYLHFVCYVTTSRQAVSVCWKSFIDTKSLIDSHFTRKYLFYRLNNFGGSKLKGIVRIFKFGGVTRLIRSGIYFYASLVSLINTIMEKLFFFKYFFGGIFSLNFFVQYSALLHLPPLRFHCADRTQDRCNWCIGSQTL